MTSLTWPADWQPEAVEAVSPFVGTDTRVEILVGDPHRSVHGSMVAGYLYTHGDTLMVIYDRSGRPDVYPWPLLAGPVLRAAMFTDRGRRKVLYSHPTWSPPSSR